MDDDAPSDHDAIIEFATYEEFLDSQISTVDLYYLEVKQPTWVLTLATFASISDNWKLLFL